MAGTGYASARRAAIAVLASLLATTVLVVIAPLAWAASPVTVTQTAGPNPVASGGTITYTIVVKNTGGAKVDQVVMTDTVQGITNPDGQNSLQMTSSVGTCNQSGNTVTCNAGTLQGGQQWTVTIAGKVTQANGTTLNNTATVTGTKSAQTFSTSATISVPVSGATGGGNLPDLLATVKGPNTTLPSSDTVYTVTLQNVGTAPASGVTATVTVPTSVTFVTATATNLLTCGSPSSGTITCSGGAVSAGGSATIQVGVTAPNFATTVTVTAQADPFNTIAESNEANNSGQATTQVGTTPPAGTLAIQKSDAPDPLAPYEQLTYTVTVTNTSTSRADYVTITDGTQGLDASTVSAAPVTTDAAGQKPASVPFTCTVSAPTVTCSSTKLQPGGKVVVTIRGTVIAVAGTTILNTATVNGNISNTGVTNTASTITSIRPARDLTVTQALTTASPVRMAGQFDYTITVGNSGLYDATNVEVYEPLPTGVVFDGFTPSVAGTTCSVAAGTNNLSCSIPVVHGASTQVQGTTETIVVHLIAPQGTQQVGSITSTVTVDPANKIAENDETNNTATTTTPVATGIDLTVSKTGTPDPVARNGTLTYTITVENQGTQDSEGVLVRDVLPSGAVFRNAFDDPGDPHNFTCSASSGVVDCVGGRLDGTYSGSLQRPVDVATITINVFAPDAPGTYHNEVRVDPLSAIPEIDETNNLFVLNTNVENTSAAGAGVFKELSISLDEVNPDPPAYATSGVLDYNLVVTNTGASDAFNSADADNVKVQVNLPAGSTYRSASDLAGAGAGAFTCAPQGGSVVLCSGGTVLAGGGSRTIRIQTFAPSTPGTALIQATVDPSNEIGEGDETNNSADESTVIQAGEPPTVQGSYNDLKFGPLTAPTTIGTNAALDYAIPVQNLGSAEVFGVTFTVTLPAGTVFRSADDADPADTASAFTCTQASGVVTCSGGHIGGGGTGARTVNVKVFAPNQPSTSDPTTRAHLVAQLDPANAIPEGDEANNAAEAFTKVVIDGPGGYVNLQFDPAASTTVVTKPNSDGSVQPGGEVVYTLAVTNSGTDDAFQVAVRDVLPTGMTFVSALPDSGSNFTCSQADGVVDCTGGYVKGTDSAGSVAATTRKIVVKAKAPLVHDVDIVNQAFVDPANAIPENSEVDNTLQQNGHVTAIVDLTASMGSGSAGSASEGDWTFTVANADGDASGVKVVANFSAGTIQLNTAAPAGWSCQVTENPVNQVTCVGNLTTGNESASFTVHYYKTADETINSTVTVDPDNTVVESHEDNNTSSATG